MITYRIHTGHGQGILKRNKPTDPRKSACKRPFIDRSYSSSYDIGNGTSSGQAAGTTAAGNSGNASTSGPAGSGAAAAASGGKDEAMTEPSGASGNS